MIATLCLAALPLSLDDDLRDRVVLDDGDVHRGRVEQRFDPEVVVLAIGGKREEFPRDEVAELDTVNDRLRRWLGMRQASLGLDASWDLVAVATHMELHSMARLQAHHVLSLDPAHVDAHRFLGHRQRRDEWQWAWDGKFYDLEDWNERLSDWGHPLTLTSEHHHLRTDTGIVNAVNVLIDLERAHVAWYEEFGPELWPREVLEPMRFEVYGDVERFPKLSTAALPYFSVGGSGPNVPLGSPPGPQGPQNHLATTFQEVADDRPRRLFDLATQHLIYASLLEGTHGGGTGDLYGRQAAWVEVGLGYWFGGRFVGAPGYAKLQAGGLDALTARFAQTRIRRGPLKNRDQELTNLAGLPYHRFHELNGERDVYWAKSRAFVAWLLEPSTVIGERTGREGLVRYLRDVYGKPTAHSTQVLDDALGDEVDDLRAAWLAWLGTF